MKSNKLLAVAAAIIILNFTLISGSCESDQINVNEAPKAELNKIIWIGDSTAKGIVDNRPFNSLDELKEVKYIGDTKVKEIKNESLACVENSEEEKEPSNKNKNQEPKKEDENEEEKENEETEKTEEKSESEQTKEEVNLERKEENSQQKQKSRPQEPIKLNAKDIKNQTNTKNSQNKIDYTKYGLTGITILVIFLFLAREIKHQKKYKNEFSG